MSLSRFNALDASAHRSELDINFVEAPSGPITSFFGQNVFGDAAMRQYLPEQAYLSVKATIQTGAKLSRDVADVVADAMKRWSMDKGATHYAHWFQPWTGKTAEKHDSFFTMRPDGSILEEFSGGALVQQEPDGSSFPKGGLRTTFEARGYTAWDPSSPAFIMQIGDDATLCVPTIFVTYTGDAQDFKLPLLRSIEFLNNAAVPICQWFNPSVTRINSTLGWEQEYFLIDEALYNSRPDLVMTGRTLVGKLAAKNQQLEDHYFGAIPERVYAYMRDLEIECHKLGIPVRTRHNEVAPGQYELAPMFEELNVAVDHNQLLMDVMDRVAHRHKLRCLLHEKPFAGINGSGKHNNWSMATNLGKNLLSPGDDPANNLQFLTFFVNIIMAVYKHADVLRATIATASNDHRLGANEAPPAIISVYIGTALTNVLDQILKGKASADDVKKALDLVQQIPNLEMDNTDRNRTSPFAFTGNKFEVRAVGSSQNCAGPMSVLNMMMGNQLVEFRSAVEKLTVKGKDRDEAIMSVLRTYIKESRAVRFEGDNYSEEWKNEALKRGLKNTISTPEALDALVTPEAEAMFAASGVFKKRELHAYHDVLLESYSLKIDIESKCLEELCYNHILPASMSYSTKLAENIAAATAAGIPESALAYQTETLKKLSNHIAKVYEVTNKMAKARDNAHEAATSTRDTAVMLCYQVKPLLETIRESADALEFIVADNEWPLVKYREMLFIR